MEMQMKNKEMQKRNDEEIKRLRVNMEQLQRGKGVVRDSLQGRFPTQPLSNPRNLYVANTVDEANASASCSSTREVLGIAIRDGEILDQKNGNVEREEDDIEERQEEKPSEPEDLPSIPYPQALQGPKKPSQEDHNNPLIKSLQETNVSVPLVEALKYIPAFQKYVKDLVTPRWNKRIKLSETVSYVLLDKFPTKKRDPGAPLITCEVGGKKFIKTLLDSGASVNILPKMVYDRLKLGEIEPACIDLLLADGSVRQPLGKLEDVVIKVKDHEFLIDFIVTHTSEPKHFSHAPIILGRPFLATSRAVQDWGKGVVRLKIGEEEVEIDVSKIMKYSVASCEEACACAIFENHDEDILDFSYDELIEKAEDRDLKRLPSSLKYAFLDPHEKFPVIISSNLDSNQEIDLLEVLRQHRFAIAWSLEDIKGISPEFCEHRIYLEDNVKPSREAQRRLNPHMREILKEEVLKWLKAEIIYPISDSPWISPVHMVPKKSGITVESNHEGVELTTRLTTGWRVCIDYWKLNLVTKKDHYPIPFMDQILEKLAGQTYYCFLDGYSGYNQIGIYPGDQEKTTFTCPKGTYAFRRMPFGLCNAPATFERCTNAMFSELVGDCLEIFMDDFSIFGSSFESCLSRLTRILQLCIQFNLVLNWKKSHFMVQEGIALGHQVSKRGLEVENAKTEVIKSLPLPSNLKEVRSFLGHTGFYRRFIQNYA